MSPSRGRGDAVAYLNDHAGGWTATMGLRLVEAGPDEVIAELEVDARHLQAYGVVHGGVHAGIIETVCSVGAALHAAARGQSVVGLENTTSFLRAARGGRLRVVARPLTRGRRSQVWEATVSDEAGRALAVGRVRLLCLEPGADLAGEPAGLPAPPAGPGQDATGA